MRFIHLSKSLDLSAIFLAEGAERLPAFILAGRI